MERPGYDPLLGSARLLGARVRCASIARSTMATRSIRIAFAPP